MSCPGSVGSQSDTRQVISASVVDSAEWLLFADWCRATGRASLPATTDTVTAFFVELPASHRVQADRRRAIRARHRMAELSDPCPTVGDQNCELPRYVA